MKALHVCSLWCWAECSHGLPCEIFTGAAAHPHPTAKGHPEHFAYDSDSRLAHRWHGERGRCQTWEVGE